MTRLPRSTDELGGLRAARWVRESTERQGDRFGPDAQREQQDRAIERFGVVDTGVAWQVAHSGRTIATTGAWADMIARAGHDYDVLLVGYVSRFARDLRTAVNARHDLHAAGAALLFCDERVLSSDEDAWEQWAREAVEAEAYSRRLGKRIREGYAAKFRRLADQGGAAPLGFHRGPPAQTLAIDPDTIERAVAIFEAYATGTRSYADIGDAHGLDTGAVREVLRNPIYNGWVRRHRRATNEERLPAAWRDHPPVSDALWERVEQLRSDRTRSTAPRSAGEPGLLAGLLWCVCGERVTSNGIKRGERILIHPGRPCEAWGPRRTQPASFYDDAIAAQLTGVRLDAATIARVVALATAPDVPAPSGLGAAWTARRRRELALDHAASRMTDDEYISAVAALRHDTPAPAPAAHVDASEVVERLRSLPAVWARAAAPARRDLVHSVYERIRVRGRAFDGVRLRPEVAHWLAIALPETVGVVSREGVRLSTPIPVDDRRGYLEAAHLRQRSA